VIRALLILSLAIALAIAAAPFLLRPEPANMPRLRAPLHVRLARAWRILRLQLRLSGDLGVLYFRRGKSEVVLVLTIANPAAPTVAEIGAGVPFSNVVAALSDGWKVALNRVSQEVLGSQQDRQVDGPIQPGDASFSLLDDDGVGSDADSVYAQAVSAAMVIGTSGYVVISPRTKSLVATKKVHVYPIKIGQRNDDMSLATQPARYDVDFVITGEVKQSVAIAA
jgi:hypothetical protein